MQLPAGLADIVEQNDRGKILVSQGSARRFILFGGGRVRQVASALESERMGNWLVARGVVDRRSVETASAARRESERLGDALIRMLLVSANDLANELRLRSVAIAARMLGEAGTVACDPAAQVPEGPECIDSEPIELFVASARRGSDAGRLETALGGDTRWAAAPGVPSRAERVELSAFERFVLGQMSGPRSLAELRQAAPDQRVEVLRALAVLVVAGLAGPPARAEAPSTGIAPATATGNERAAGRYLVLPPASPRVKERLATPAAPAFRGAPPVPPAGEWRLPASPAAPPPPREPAPAPVPPRAAGETTPVPDATAHDAASSSSPPVPEPPSAEQLDAAAADRQEAFESLRRGDDLRTVYRLLTRAVEVAPDPEALLAMARIELANPLWRQRALDHLKTALSLHPGLTAAWLELANYWSLRGEPDKQRRCLEAVLRYEPAHREVREALGLLRGDGS